MHESPPFGRAVARRVPAVSFPPSQPAVAPRAAHHPGLYWLCAVELCERLAGYMVFSLLVFYLNESRGLGTGAAAKVASYAQVLLYVAGVLGGVLADRRLGAGRAALGGLILLTLGYTALAWAQESASGLWAAVGLIIAGYGLFRPNITALVGALYPPGDPRRATAFRWFYYSVNGGALLGPGLGGVLRTWLGWQATFQAAAACMAVALGLWGVGRQFLVGGVQTPGWPLGTAAAGTLPASRRAAADDSRTYALGLVLGVTAIFGVALSQSYGTLLLWARDDAERTLWGQKVPPDFFAMLPAGFVLLLGPLLEWRTKARQARGLQVSESGTFTAGMLLCALAYGLMLLASVTQRDSGLASSLWLVGCTLALSLGELLGMPMGLSLAAALAQSRSKGLVLGLTYSVHALGFWLGGAFSALWPVWAHAQFFGTLALGCLLAAVLIQSQGQRWARVQPRRSPATLPTP